MKLREFIEKLTEIHKKHPNAEIRLTDPSDVVIYPNGIEDEEEDNIFIELDY